MDKVSNELKSAIALLKENDYIVIKMTPRMIADADECESMSEKGNDKNCMSCSCNKCVVQC